MKKIIAFILLTISLLSLNVYAEVSQSVAQAPDIKLLTVDGSVQLSDFKGKVVYLDF